MKVPKKQWQRVRLNQQCKADIAWWSLFVQDWNGIALLAEPRQGPTVVADASGSWGCGAFITGTLEWFQVQWPPAWQGINIAAKELLPIVMAMGLWGQAWKGTCVQLRSDNQAVVAALRRRSARDSQMMHLLRCMFFFMAQFQFEYRVEHLPGKENRAADALSRDHLAEFHSLFPQAPHSPTTTPPALLEMLLDPSLTWTSPRWNSLFANILHKALPSQPRGPIPLPSNAISHSAGSTGSTHSSGQNDLRACSQLSLPSRVSGLSPLQHTLQQ